MKQTQNPVWNFSYKVQIPLDSNMIHCEILEQVAIGTRELSRVKLHFEHLNSENATFAGKSLAYSYDGMLFSSYRFLWYGESADGDTEETDFPLVVEGKGKGKEQPVLRIGMSWKGRKSKVEELGYPSSPPGKMFGPN